ncbi:hypothetical protein CEJ45_24165 [Herbaspirillum aquaticum]|uniref:Uncharacterized protein n=1 Tax=Herbaspirillum aquaticum TaxID=568783 RepID=A0A225SN21_9BURK|nr:hypothetical protein CEJ45_24165 [Herbaspirillum aquaticum]
MGTVTLTGSFLGLQYDLLLAGIFGGCVALSFTRQTPLLRMAITLITSALVAAYGGPVRLGAAWCDGGTPGPAQASGAAGGDGAGTAGRLLPPELDSAVRTLIGQAEEAAATARAAQAFIRENGMAPP